MSGGRPWTRHGHAIEGVTVVDPLADRPPIARCGGPALCSKCATDAEWLRRKAHILPTTHTAVTA